jgi:hypothetical protein
MPAVESADKQQKQTAAWIIEYFPKGRQDTAAKGMGPLTTLTCADTLVIIRAGRRWSAADS